MARNFGRLNFWHLVPAAPKTGSPAKRAAELISLIREGRIGELSPGNQKKAPDILRALALELAIADTHGAPEVHELLAEAEMPKWAFAALDPVHVYSGDGAGPGPRRQVAWRRLEPLARAFDVEAVTATDAPLRSTPVWRS